MLWDHFAGAREHMSTLAWICFFLTIPCNRRHYSGFPTNRFNVVEKMGLIRRDQCDLAAAISLVLTCGISPATAVDIWWLVATASYQKFPRFVHSTCTSSYCTRLGNAQCLMLVVIECPRSVQVLQKMFCVQECVREQLRVMFISKANAMLHVAQAHLACNFQFWIRTAQLDFLDSTILCNCSLTHSWIQNIFCKTWTLLGLY